MSPYSDDNIVELDAHRGGFRSIGDIARDCVVQIGARRPLEALRGELTEARRNRRIAERMIENAQRLNVSARLRGGSPSPALAQVQVSSSDALEAARSYRNALIQTVQLLEDAIAAHFEPPTKPAA